MNGDLPGMHSGRDMSRSSTSAASAAPKSGLGFASMETDLAVLQKRVTTLEETTDEIVQAMFRLQEGVSALTRVGATKVWFLNTAL